MDEKQIGLIGLGLLGTALAERLLGAGLRVLGYDVEASRRAALRDRGGAVAENAAAVAASCDRVLLSLPTSDVVAEVVEETAGRLRVGQIIIDTTTGDPEQTAATGRRLAERGVEYLDATVSGSSEQARRGDVVVMAGGRREAFEACRDVFRCFAREAHHVGPWGNGAKMKLATNLVLGLNRAALAEGLAFAEALGLDPADTLPILMATMAYSRIMDTKGEKMVRGDFAPQARLRQHLKDVRLILAAASAEGLDLPLSQAHRRLLELVEAAGYGDADNSAVIEAYRQ